MLPWNCALLAMALFSVAIANPMMYKKNERDIYEPDLVASSSTVIPLSVYEVTYGVGGRPSEAYKQAYIKSLLKKMKNKDGAEDPDTLITLKKKFYEHKKM